MITPAITAMYTYFGIRSIPSLMAQWPTTRREKQSYFDGLPRYSSGFPLAFHSSTLHIVWDQEASGDSETRNHHTCDQGFCRTTPPGEVRFIC